MNKFIKVLIPLTLSIAFISAITWAIFTPDFEPAITALALLASLIAIFTDRWVLLRERRREVLRIFANELYMNLGVIKNLMAAKQMDNVNKPHVYPRFYTTSLMTAISSGLFTESKDKELWKLMNGWLQKATDFNNRLTISEFHVFSNPDAAQKFNNKVTEGLAAVEAIEACKYLIEFITNNYESESGIGPDTILFSD